MPAVSPSAPRTSHIFLNFQNYPGKKLPFHFNSATYLLIVDYFSRFIEVAKLSTQSSLEVIRHTKSVFSRHGIPREVISDNGPQYSSLEYAHFAAEYGFIHTTSSPKYPQSNGEAERAVQTIKQLLRKSEDPHMALMIYRSTPLHIGYSPSELLMNRKIRTIPILDNQLKPSVPDYAEVREKEVKRKTDNKTNFDVRHGADLLDPLDPGQSVWIAGRRDSGIVVQPTEAPRSYLVSTPTGIVRRNHQHLTTIPEDNSCSDTARAGSDVTVRSQTTRSGRTSVPPKRLISDPQWNTNLS